MLDPLDQSLLAGPILYARGADERSARLTALVVVREGASAPELLPEGGDPVAPRPSASYPGAVVWLYDFELPAEGVAFYRLGERRFPVVCNMTGDARIAFVSCNGQENGDADRTHEDRDVMWRRLLEDHRRSPFALMLHGGDQLYADEATRATADLRRWHEGDPQEKLAVAMTAEMRDALRRFFFERYLAIIRQPAAAELFSSVPSLMIWDDHDICDGWGSHPRALQDSEVGGALFEVAREAFVVFQLGGALDQLPSTCLDPHGRTLSTAANFPGFSVILPDLRSERRPDLVMGEAGWQAFERALVDAPEGSRRLVVSSVPTLGPRMSLVESVLDFLPRANKYEDDLRDQWQSRAHRDEWIRWLARLEREQVERRSPVTVISGEIHLAGRATMQLSDGGCLHQLVASGITHPEPPSTFARALDLLSNLGDSPLEGRPIRVRRLPGQSRRYVPERNFLVLMRKRSQWTAEWHLERSGRTPALQL